MICTPAIGACQDRQGLQGVMAGGESELGMVMLRSRLFTFRHRMPLLSTKLYVDLVFFKAAYR